MTENTNADVLALIADHRDAVASEHRAGLITVGELLSAAAARGVHIKALCTAVGVSRQSFYAWKAGGLDSVVPQRFMQAALDFIATPVAPRAVAEAEPECTAAPARKSRRKPARAVVAAEAVDAQAGGAEAASEAPAAAETEPTVVETTNAQPGGAGGDDAAARPAAGAGGGDDTDDDDDDAALEREAREYHAARVDDGETLSHAELLERVAALVADDVAAIKATVQTLGRSRLSATEEESVLAAIRAQQKDAGAETPPTLAALRADLRAARRSNDAAGSGDRTSAAEVLFSLVEGRVILWRDARTDDAMMTTGAGEHLQIGRTAGADFLRRCWTEERPGGRQVLPDDAISSVQATLAARARALDPTAASCIRYAALRGDDGDPAGVFVDIGDRSREALLVAPGRVQVVGADVVDAAGVRFVQPSSARGVVRPQLDASPDDALAALGRLVSLYDAADTKLLVGVLVGSMLPLPATLPVLGLLGDHGAGKSAVARGLKHLLDPAADGATVDPKSVDDLTIRLSKSRALVIDNVSRLSTEMSDRLCVASTGGTAPRRALFTDDDEVFLRLHCTTILTSVDEAVISRADLLDRAVLFSMTRPAQHRSDRETERLWADLTPVVSGGLLNALAAALEHIDWRASSTHGRLASTVQVLEALDTAGVCGGGFVQAFLARRKTAAADALLRSPIWRRLLQVVLSHPAQPDGSWRWAGTPSALFAAVGHNQGHGANWPQTEAALGYRLKAAAPAFAAAGVQVESTRTATARGLRISIAAETGPALRNAAAQAGAPFPDETGGVPDTQAETDTDIV